MKEDSVFITDYVNCKASQLPTKFTSKEIDDSLKLAELYHDIEEYFHRRTCRQLKPKRAQRSKSSHNSTRSTERPKGSLNITQLRLSLLREEDEQRMPKIQDQYLVRVKPDYFNLKSQTEALAEEIDSKLRPKRLKTDYGRQLKNQTLFDFYDPPRRNPAKGNKLKEAKAQKAYYEFSLPITSHSSELPVLAFKGHQTSVSRRTHSRTGTVSPFRGEPKVLRGVLKYVTVNDML